MLLCKFSRALFIQLEAIHSELVQRCLQVVVFHGDSPLQIDLRLAREDGVGGSSSFERRAFCTTGAFPDHLAHICLDVDWRTGDALLDEIILMNRLKVNEIVAGLVRIAALVADSNKLLQIFLRHRVEGEPRNLDLLKVQMLVSALAVA